MATNKQKALAKKILENPSTSMAQAMREVGYSENTVVDPQNVTKSKGWQELMDKYLPDDKVLDTHAQGLDAMKIVSARIIVKKGFPTSQANGELQPGNEQTDDFIEVPDHPTRLKAVELAYKVKRKTVDAPDGNVKRRVVAEEFFK